MNIFTRLWPLMACILCAWNAYDFAAYHDAVNLGLAVYFGLSAILAEIRQAAQ